MSRRILLSAGLLAYLLSATPRAAAVAQETPKSPPDVKKQEAPADPVGVCMDRFLKVGDLVLDKHVEPPSRQEMFLGGCRAVFTQANATPPADLSRQVSRLASDDQFRSFLKDNWPKPASDKPVDAGQLEGAFLQGLLERVPGKPGLVSAANARVMEQLAANRYVGTGIQIGVNQQAKLTQIINPFARGPARKAGAKPGDIIVEVDGVSMEGQTIAQVVDRIRGEEGTTVTMTVRQPDTKETRVLKMTRAAVPFDTVVGYQRLAEESWQYKVKADEPFAYLRLENVLPSTPSELRKLEKTLLADGVKGVVLDLRFSGGSDVQPAALTADELLDGGLMFRVHDAQNRVKEYRADRDCLFRDCRLVVLVNEQTRGAAEFIAAALQDNGRAVVVGRPTRGDGFVETMTRLPDDLGAISLRTASVERAAPPKGLAKSSAGVWQPVEPDHLVALDPGKMPALLDWQRAQLSPEPSADAPKVPPDDPQLAKALELLREAVKK